MTGKLVSNFRDRFTELIESSPKSPTVIAQEFGVAKQTISAWKTGQSSPRLPVTTALAEYFGVNIDWLLGYDVPKYVEKKPPEPEKPASDNVSLLIRGLNKLPPEQQEQALNVMRAVFAQYADYFEKGDEENESDS